MLDYRIYTFLSVCKHMSFTKASEELNITQPAVSQHIKYLESFYDTKLFSFCGKKIEITKEGQMILNALTTMVHDSIHLKEAVSLEKVKRKQLSFGATLTIGEYIVPYHMKKIMEEFAAEDINIKIANTNELLENINDGSVDFAVVEGYFNKKEYDCLTYSTEDFIGVASYKVRKLSLEELLSERIIIREKGSGTRAVFENILASHNLSVNDFRGSVIINNINAIKKMVSMGMGITFLYKKAVLEELEKGELFEINIKDTPFKYNFTFIWRKNSIYKNFYVKVFGMLKS